ncbi:MAG: hypothetical protein NTV74_02370 [Euryarchaeota archaeon]|nr:hypothetical protein [Euryarchaeota archaeon]
MVTISHVVQKIVSEQVFILEPMSRGIISYGSLAEQIRSEVEEELGKKVKTHAIVMALRRYAETLKERPAKISFDFSSEIIMKTDICDIAVRRSPTLLHRLKRLYEIVNFETGDILNIIHGRYEVSVVTNERYREKSLALLKEEKILNVERELVSLTLTFSKEFLYTPGIIFNAVRNIAWESINIYEIVSTNTELTFIINKKDAVKGYKTLERLVRNQVK